MGNRNIKGTDNGPPPIASPPSAARSSPGAVDEDESLPSPEDVTPENLTVLQLLRHGYGAVVNAFIRPPRLEYDNAELGPPQFDFRGRRFTRTDLTLRNPRGMRLVCSWWQPLESDRPAVTLPCTIFLHGNSACRLAALEALEVVLAEGSTLFAFDFAGCGKSDGDFVTLGWFERDDLACVMDHLRSSGTVSSIACWGRSMGAATALLHSHRDPSIAGLVLDSSFADLQQLCKELVANGLATSGYRVPSFLVSAALRVIRNSVKRKSGLDIFNLRPIADVDKAFIPALFCAGEEDAFIPPHHSRQLFAAYAGDKNYISVPGGHNDPRPRFFMDSAGIFLKNVLRIPEDEVFALEDPSSGSGGSALRIRAGGSAATNVDGGVRARHPTIAAAFMAALDDAEGAPSRGYSGLELAAVRAAAAEALENEMLQRAIIASMLPSSPPPIAREPERESLGNAPAATAASGSALSAGRDGGDAAAAASVTGAVHASASSARAPASSLEPPWPSAAIAEMLSGPDDDHDEEREAQREAEEKQMTLALALSLVEAQQQQNSPAAEQKSVG